MNSPLDLPLPPTDLPLPAPLVVPPGGIEPLKADHIPPECDLCRQAFAKGDPYYRITLGMDETPLFAGMPPLANSTVECTNELTVCARCEPTAMQAFESLLATFWNLRAADPVPQSSSPED